MKRIVQGSSWQLSHCFDVEFWKVVDFSNNSNREQSWLPTLPPSLPLPSSPSLPRCELHSHLVPNTVCGCCAISCCHRESVCSHEFSLEAEFVAMLSWCMWMCLADFFGLFEELELYYFVVALQCFTGWSRTCVSVG